MHFATVIRPVVVGLAVVGQAAILPLDASAQGSSLRVQSATDGEANAGTLRFAKPVVKNQARIVDHSVKQAAWNNKQPTSSAHYSAQPAARPLAGRPSAQSSAAQARTAAAPTGQRAPMFRGSEIRLPSLFNRNTSGPVTAWDPRQARQQPATSEPVGSLPGRDPASVIKNHYVPYTALQPRGMSPARQMSTPPQRSNSSDAGPRMISPQSPSRPSPAERQPTQIQTVPSQPSASAAAQSPADELILHAHELTSRAETEGDFSEIIETCRRALQNQPGDQSEKYANELTAWALNRRGQLKAEDGRTTEAIRDFDDAVQANAACWRAVHNRGVLLAQACEFESAFDDFNRTVQLNPQFGKAYSNRGALFVVAGKLDSALADYEKAIELDPKLAVAHRGAARVCHLFGRLEHALAHYNASVRLAPDDAYAIASRADLFTDLGCYTEANADYERAIKLDPLSVHANSGSAWLLATCPTENIRNPALAMARAQKAIELSGTPEAVNLDTLAAAQASNGDFRAAAESLRKAIKIAAAGEREVYQDRLTMYQHGEAYCIAPVRPIAQASYEARSGERGAGSW